MSKLHDFTQYFTTTLSKSGGLTAVETTGIVLQSISGVDDYTRPGVVCLTYANPLVQTTAEWITYTSIDNITKELQGVVRGAEGSSAKTHLNGCIIAFVLSKTQIKAMRDRLEGTSGSVVEDGTGLEILKKVGVASAVNEVTVTNAVTTAGPIVSATGDDTNIDLNLKGKGSGNVRLGTALLKFPNADGSANQALVTNGSGTLSFATAGSTDGWTDPSATWTYASASTITVPSGAASIYAVGDKIKWTQTTVKYGVITAVADTLITIAVNTDYTVANAAISANYYSHQSSPIGYPQRFNFTPSPTNWTVGNGTWTRAIFSVENRRVFVSLKFSFGSSSAMAASMAVSTPITIAQSGSSDIDVLGVASIRDSGTSMFDGRVYFVSASAVRLYGETASGTYTVPAAVTSTVPMTWTTNDEFIMEYSYEM